MRRSAFVAAFAALLTALPAAAQVESYTIDPRHTFPMFEVMHLGMSTQRGIFKKTTGKATIDRQARVGTIEVDIEAASVDTGLDRLSDHIRAEDFLHASQFPTITFRGTRFVFDGDKLRSVEGDLTMRGVTRPVTLNVQHFNCGSHPVNKKAMCGGDFTAHIKRSDWGIKYGIPGTADEMLLRINVEAYKD